MKFIRKGNKTPFINVFFFFQLKENSYSMNENAGKLKIEKQHLYKMSPFSKQIRDKSILTSFWQQNRKNFLKRFIHTLI